MGAIFEDAQGTLWIGTYDGGLSRFRDGKFVNYTTRNGLYSDGVFQILEDARGWFWMSSNQGIYRVSRKELEDLAEGRTPMITSTAFGKSDGMLITECNGGRQPAGLKTRDGNSGSRRKTASPSSTRKSCRSIHSPHPS